MSSRPAPRKSSWFRRLAGFLSARRQPEASGKRGLGFEHLEGRAMMSADILPSMSGVVFHDLKQDGLTADDVRLSNVTVNLFRDGGNGQFGGKASGSDDQLVGTVTTDANGVYRFNNLAVGTYFVQQVAVPGVVLPTGQDVVKFAVTAADLKGTAGTVIDSFDSTAQYVSGSLYQGKTGSSTVTATEAIGGHRDLFVQLTSRVGSVSLGANANVPGYLDFASGSASNGTYWITWDGDSADAQTLNATGLGQRDLTGQGTATGIKFTMGADHDNAYVRLNVYTDAGNWSWVNVAIPKTDDGSTGEDVFVPWSNFVTGGGSGANFTKVGAIRMEIVGVNAVDGQIAGVGAVGPKVLAQNFANVSRTDLAITKTDSPHPVTAGNTLNYTLTVTNNGPSDATGVTVTDTLPPGVTYIPIVGSPYARNFAGGVLTINVGALASGASVSIPVGVTVNSSTTAALTNTAVVTGNETDTNPANNTATVTTPVTTLVDLAIQKIGQPDPVKAGKQLTYTLTAKNNGPSDATGVKITDTLPAGVTFDPTSSQGSITANGNVLTISLGNMASGATATTTIVVSVASTTTGTLTNTAVIGANENDSDPSNNTATCTTKVDVPVIPKAIVDLAIVKTALPDTVTVGQNLVYTLQVSNNSTFSAANVTVADTVPTGASIISVSSSQGTANYNGNSVSASLGTVAKNGSATITIVVRVNSTAGSTLTNTATVSTTDEDSEPSNNTSAVVTPVTRSNFGKYLFFGRR